MSMFVSMPQTLSEQISGIEIDAPDIRHGSVSQSPSFSQMSPDPSAVVSEEPLKQQEEKSSAGVDFDSAFSGAAHNALAAVKGSMATSSALAHEYSPVGTLAANRPLYVQQPPIEAVVFAWGVNEDGQLGLDSDGNVGNPKVVESLLGIQMSGRAFARSPLVAGSRNSLAIDADGQVWTWGWNARGTLGHGHRGNESKPKRINTLQGVKIVQVAVNGWHCLALSDSGQVFSWGGNEYLQCGVDPDKRDIVSPVICVPQLKVRMVACGGMHSLALTETGEVWTWGEPWGDFSLRVERNPRPVPKATGMAAIACGAFHNMAVSRRGEVYTWGTNDYGQLGNGNTSYQTEPRKVPGLEGVQVADIAAGGWHSLALSKRGEVFAWGRGEYGRLGIGDRSGSSKLRPHRVRGLEGHKIVQITAGGTHTVALSSRGRMFIWGRGSFGRLGLNAEKDHYTAVECCLPGGYNRWRVIAVASGGRHSLCLAMPVREGFTPMHEESSDEESGSEGMDGASEPSLFDREAAITLEDYMLTPPIAPPVAGSGSGNGNLSRRSSPPIPTASSGGLGTAISLWPAPGTDMHSMVAAQLQMDANLDAGGMADEEDEDDDEEDQGQFQEERRAMSPMPPRPRSPILASGGAGMSPGGAGGPLASRFSPVRGSPTNHGSPKPTFFAMNAGFGVDGDSQGEDN